MNLAFDIGYNLGDFSKGLLRMFPETCIVGVEANHILLPYTFKNENVVVVNAAVSDQSNITIEFYISPIHTISTANKIWMDGRFRGSRWDQPIKVLTITLDDLITNYGEPDLIKIDVEGYELSVLKGLTKKSGIILFEWTEETFHKETLKCIDYVKNLGYTQFAYTNSKTEHGAFLNDLTYCSWDDLSIHKNINPRRQEEWGMIYTK